MIGRLDGLHSDTTCQATGRRLGSTNPSPGWSRREMLRLRRDNPVVDGHWLVKIDSQACSDCQACLRICPQAALARAEQDGFVVYSLNARRCNGCGECNRVCAETALQLARGDEAGETCEVLRLVMATCTRCGEITAGCTEGLCFVCRHYNARLRTSRHQMR